MSAAKFWWKRHEDGFDLNSKPRSGRPNVLNENQKKEIIDRIEENPFSTAVSFAREYGVDRKTISAEIKRNNLQCRTAATQTKLTEEHKINRIAFCRMLLEEWDDDKLKSIVFSDEKTFCTDVSWRSKVYRPFNTRYEPKYVKTSTRSGRITNNYWGAIGNEGPLTDLVRIDGKYNSHKYMRIIRTHVTPMMRNSNPPKIFMQDNSPVHTAGNVMALLSRQNFELMDWPPLSPDLNPIENVWSYMENNWPTIHPRNVDTLDVVVQERWTQLHNNHGKHFLFSMKINVNIRFILLFFQNIFIICIDHYAHVINKS